jgi:hypothetical protein
VVQSTTRAGKARVGASFPFLALQPVRSTGKGGKEATPPYFPRASHGLQSKRGKEAPHGLRLVQSTLSLLCKATLVLRTLVLRTLFLLCNPCEARGKEGKVASQGKKHGACFTGKAREGKQEKAQQGTNVKKVLK